MLIKCTPSRTHDVTQIATRAQVSQRGSWCQPGLADRSDLLWSIFNKTLLPGKIRQSSGTYQVCHHFRLLIALVDCGEFSAASNFIPRYPCVDDSVGRHAWPSCSKALLRLHLSTCLTHDIIQWQLCHAGNFPQVCVKHIIPSRWKLIIPIGNFIYMTEFQRLAQRSKTGHCTSFYLGKNRIQTMFFYYFNNHNHNGLELSIRALAQHAANPRFGLQHFQHKTSQLETDVKVLRLRTAASLD